MILTCMKVASGKTRRPLQLILHQLYFTFVFLVIV